MENGEPIGSLGAGEAVWHTDMSYLDDPPKASMLYALEIPPAGGNTSFCNMYAVYDALPDALKRAHRGPADQARRHLQQRRLCAPGRHRRPTIPRTSPGALHPLVCTHPETGRRMLYLGRRRNAYIGGLAACRIRGAARRTVELSSTRPEFAWEHVWRVGDLVLWDNRCTMHRRDAFDPYARRIMHRTQIKGRPRPA